MPTILRKIALVTVLALSAASVALPAHAATLTDPQIQAIVSLLDAFGVDSATVAAVDAELHGNAGAAASATFDQASVTDPTNTFTLTGRASGASSIFVALVPSSYSGSTAWADIYANRAFTAFTGNGVNPVKDGKWSASLSGIPSGTYAALVYSGDDMQTLLGKESLTVVAPDPINFVVGTGVTGTVGVGQAATDGRVTIVPTSVGYANGTSGDLRGTFIVSVAGFTPTIFAGGVGDTVGAADENVSSGSVTITLRDLSMPMRTATLRIAPNPASH